MAVTQMVVGYLLSDHGLTVMNLPQTAQVVSVSASYGNVFLWALAEARPHQPRVEHRFWVTQQGEFVTRPIMAYVGVAQDSQYSGRTYHVFEVEA